MDVGGTHVKLELSGQSERREFKSGPKLTAKRVIGEVKRLAADWSYDVVSIGYPGLVVRDRVVAEWPAPGLDDTDLSEPGPALELHRA